MKDELEGRPGLDAPRADALATHAAECSECRGGSRALADIERVLGTAPVEIDATMMSQRVLVSVGPELQRLATRAFRHRVATVLVSALAPLPVVAVYDALLLRVWYLGISALLPAAMAVYLVASYAALLILLFALTYAAIPLLLVRDPAPYVPART